MKDFAERPTIGTRRAFLEGMPTNNHSKRTSPHLDILRRERDGSFLWIEAADDLELATKRMEELAASVPGEYFVFDQRSQDIVAKIVAGAAKALDPDKEQRKYSENGMGNNGN